MKKPDLLTVNYRDRKVSVLGMTPDNRLCTEGYNGEHATSVNGTGSPALADFICAGAKVQITEQRSRQLIEEVADNCRDLTRYNIKYVTGGGTVFNEP